MEENVLREEPGRDSFNLDPLNPPRSPHGI